MAQLQRKGQEKLRGKIMEMVKQGLKTLRAASRELGISYSQAKRIYQRYLAGGDEALAHGNTGRPSNNKTDEGIVKKAVDLYREKYCDFGPTLARETLSERDGLEISVSTLRRALIAAGLWKQHKNGSAYRSRRAPRAHFGELVQFDGSHHDWFEGRGPRCCLMTMIDDATKIRLSLFFDEETMFGAMTLLKRWIERHGIPESLYGDRKNRDRSKAEQHQELSAKLRGHYAYYGITFNFKSLERFFLRIREIWYKWLNRRSDKRSLYWWQYLMYLKANPLPYPRIVHSKA
ncbi:MAG: helix-turn-helix domain-containing protein [Treponema sp.]|jgi:transposase|nr:helix-turn-helix domain-containing protein [Treponema sp.]